MEEGRAKKLADVKNLEDYSGWVKWSVPSLSYPSPTHRDIQCLAQEGVASAVRVIHPSIDDKECIFLLENFKATINWLQVKTKKEHSLFGLCFAFKSPRNEGSWEGVWTMYAMWKRSRDQGSQVFVLALLLTSCMTLASPFPSLSLLLQL